MHLKTVLKYMRRSPYQSISAFLIMWLTFFVISTFAILTILSVRVIDYLESRPQLTIFFSETVQPEDIDSLKSSLEATGKTISVKYISKEEALKIYTKDNKDDPLLLDLVTADILPSSLEVQTIQPEYIRELVPLVKDAKNVSDVVYQQDIIDTLISWTNALRIGGVALISVLILVSVLVILTIIGIKITIRREEIEIMRLIGASNWFIRTPFLLEGMLYGFLGAFFGFGCAYGIFLLASPQIAEFLKGLPVLPISWLLAGEVFAVEVIIASFLGAFASYIAVLRYLK